MTVKQSTAIKAQIIKAIKHIKDTLGYTLVCDSWGDSRCVCALGCVLLTDDPEAVIDGGEEDFDALVGLLCVSEDWIDSFLDGFDGNGVVEFAKDADGWKAGAAVRKEVKPISYLEMVDE